MNRRKFFGLLAAAPIAATVVKPSKDPFKSPDKWTTNLERFNQQMIVNATKLPRRLYKGVEI